MFKQCVIIITMVSKFTLLQIKFTLLQIKYSECLPSQRGLLEHSLASRWRALSCLNDARNCSKYGMLGIWMNLPGTPCQHKALPLLTQLGGILLAVSAWQKLPGWRTARSWILPRYKTKHRAAFHLP